MEEISSVRFPYTQVYDDETTEMIENEFSRTKGNCYLDHAGATLYSDTQIKNVTADLHHSLYANPHSVGAASSLTQDIIEHMRYRILDHFHITSDEYSVIFTSGATASLRIVAESFMFNKNGSAASHSGHFVYTQDNHTSVLGMREVVAERGAKVTFLSHNEAFKIFHNPSNVSSYDTQQANSNSLFVYPAQCNFSGLKYPLQWIKHVQNGTLSNTVSKACTKWYVLLDAAAFVPTNDMDLSIFKPDFVCISFYKMFGYPTGVGALLVKNTSSDVLRKVYYGGGTVDVSLSSEMFHIKRSTLHQRFEDGTVPFLSVISLKHGFDILSNTTMKKISSHVFSLARFLHHSLLMLHHSNDKPAVKLYSDTAYESSEIQGGIVTFNLMRPNGEYVGYMEVLNMAALFNIHLRTGCFCNPGACQRHLALTNKEILQNYDAGYVCGGATDLINGKPTGAVRISFGYMSTIKDVQILLRMIRKCFVDGLQINRLPSWWENYKTTVHKKYNQQDTNTKDIQEFQNNASTIKIKFQNVKKSLCNVISGTQFFNSIVEIDNSINECILERLYIYPIKSCAAYEITSSWILNSKGLEYDREWMIMTSSGTCLTQKQHIKLCLLQPIVCKEKKVMKLCYPGMTPIEVSLEENTTDVVEGKICQSKICGHKVEGVDCGLEVSKWLSLALDRPNLRLVKQSRHKNKEKESNKPELSFSSQAQYLAINKASVLSLVDKISDTELRKDTFLYRFRGNLIITGYKAFEEMHWNHMRIGKNDFVVNGPCTRCQMICVDQTTGAKTIEPLRTLAEQFHGKLRFGVYLTKKTENDGVINIGDPVHIV